MNNLFLMDESRLGKIPINITGIYTTKSYIGNSKDFTCKSSDNSYMRCLGNYDIDIIKYPASQSKGYDPEKKCLFADVVARNKEFSIGIQPVDIADPYDYKIIKYEKGPSCVFKTLDSKYTKHTEFVVLVDVEANGRTMSIRTNDDHGVLKVAECNISDNGLTHNILWFYYGTVCENIIPWKYTIFRDDEDEGEIVWHYEYLTHQLKTSRKYFTDDLINDRLSINYFNNIHVSHHILKSPIYIDNGVFHLSDMNSISEGRTGIMEIFEDDNETKVLFCTMNNKDLNDLLEGGKLND